MLVELARTLMLMLMKKAIVVVVKRMLKELAD
jgi:hypothetical protein